MTRSIRLGAQRTIRPLADLDDVPPSFIRWLRARGAEILGTTNPWEVLRFRANGRTSVVYRRRHGRISACTGDVEAAWRHYQAGTSWSAGTARSRLNRPKTRQRIVDTRLLGAIVQAPYRVQGFPEPTRIPPCPAGFRVSGTLVLLSGGGAVHFDRGRIREEVQAWAQPRAPQDQNRS